MATRDAIDSVAIELMARGNNSGDQWVHLLPAGTFSGRDGRGPYQLADATAVMNASREHSGRAHMAIDYDHQIDYAGKNGAPAPAAGWIKALQARADGIWGLVEWTERAAAHLAKREYRYLSPVFNHTGGGNVTRLLRAALTNNPNLDQLTALASMENTMDKTSELRRLLALPDDADMAAIVSKVSDLLTARQAAAPDPAKYVPIGDFERAVSEVHRLNQGISLQAATDHVGSNIDAGKLPPFLKEWGVSLCSVNKPAFDDFVKRSGGIFKALTTPSRASAMPPDDLRESQLTEEETTLCASMGITPDQFLATRAARTQARG
jgi:phage I-like protein